MASVAEKRHNIGRVSIFKRNKYWWAYYRAGGQQHRFSLKVTNVKVALEKARSIDDQLQAGGETKLLAVRKSGQKTFAELIREFEANYTRWNETTWKGNRHRLNELLAQWGQMPCNAITQLDIDRYLAEKQQTISPASRNRLLATIRTIFKAAVDWNFITHSPASDVSQLPEASQIPDALSDEQVESLLKALPEYAQLIVTILVYTGLRKSELHRITWGDIDFKNNELAIRMTKNSEFRVIPMHPQVRKVFSELQPGRSWPKSQSGHSRKTIVWPDSKNPSAIAIPHIDIKKSLISASKRCGIGHVYPHMLRHTFATKMRDNGVPLDRIQVFLGHKTMAMVLRYAKARPEQLQKAIEKI